jgi:hypothetical protein
VRLRHSLAAVGAAAVAVATFGATAAEATATSAGHPSVPHATSADRTSAARRAADAAAGYLAIHLSRDRGWFAKPASAAFSKTVSADLALVADGTGKTAVAESVRYLQHHVDAVVGNGTPKGDDPGRLAYLIMLARATGHSATAFGPKDVKGGDDLVKRLLATDGQSQPGVFGSASFYPGAYSQSLALLALAAARRTPPPKTVSWLERQQCPDGGWLSYQGASCGTSGEDTNTTALAVQALHALGVHPAHNPRGYFRKLQDSDGGFPFQAGSPTDADSTGLVLQALAALRVKLSSLPHHSPIPTLLRLQLGCSSPAGDRGGFRYKKANHHANILATAQALPGLLAAPFPLGNRRLGSAHPMSC